MDQHTTSRPSVERLGTVEAESDNLISLPAWQRARHRLEHYLSLLDLPEPVRQRWASIAFARALRRQGSDEGPARLVMRELHALLDENGARIGDRIARTGTDGHARRSVQRTPLRPASLERGLARRGRAWLLLLIARLSRLHKALRAVKK